MDTHSNDARPGTPETGLLANATRAAATRDNLAALLASVSSQPDLNVTSAFFLKQWIRVRGGTWLYEMTRDGTPYLASWIDVDQSSDADVFMAAPLSADDKRTLRTALLRHYAFRVMLNA